MNKYLGDPPPQSARADRTRLANAEREAIMMRLRKKATAVGENMAHLRELRLAKEAQEVRTEIATSTKEKSKNNPGSNLPDFCGVAHDDSKMSVRRSLRSN
jgi:hypothetical protein